jgi:hypothetical protein
MFFSFLKTLSGDETETVRIKFTGRLSLDEDVLGILESLRPAYKHRPKNKTVILDLSEVEFIYPSALLFFASVNEIMAKRGHAFEIEVESGSPVHDYLDYSGVCAGFEIPTFPKDGTRTIDPTTRVFKLQRGSIIPHSYQAAVALVDLFKASQPLSPLVEAATIDSIDEMLRNILQHSAYSEYLLLGQSYPQSGRIRFVIADNGCGIKEHVTRLPYKERHSRFRELVTKSMYSRMKSQPANVAIEQAARYEVSGTNYSKNSGAGLHFLIHNLSVPTNGTVCIFSDNGFVRWQAGEITQSTQTPIRFPGTLVSVTINCDQTKILKYSGEQLEKLK